MRFYTAWAISGRFFLVRERPLFRDGNPAHTLNLKSKARIKYRKLNMIVRGGGHPNSRINAFRNTPLNARICAIWADPSGGMAWVPPYATQRIFARFTGCHESAARRHFPSDVVRKTEFCSLRGCYSHTGNVMPGVPKPTILFSPLERDKSNLKVAYLNSVDSSRLWATLIRPE